MWFGVIATLKNQRTGTIKSKEMDRTVPNQGLISDNFRTVRLPLAVRAYASTVAVWNSLPVQ